MNTLTAKFELKSLSEEGRFTGLASVYGNRDLGGDVVVRGAFSKTLNERGGKVPLLYGHRVNVGIARLEDSNGGLLAHGTLNLDKQAARDVYSDLRFFRDAGMAFGMSIGYREVPGKAEQKGDTRYLHEVTLYETTLTEFPMNESARVSSVKAHAPVSRDGRLMEALAELSMFLKMQNCIQTLRQQRSK